MGIRFLRQGLCIFMRFAKLKITQQGTIQLLLKTRKIKSKTYLRLVGKRFCHECNAAGIVNPRTAFSRSLVVRKKDLLKSNCRSILIGKCYK